MKLNKRSIGRKYEEEAAKYLKKRGYIIINMNFRCKIGEIDIVARHKEYLVFVEVKYRKTLNQGYPSEAVNYYKQRKITKVAEFYLMTNEVEEDMDCRFDVVEMSDKEIKIIENAFEAV